MAPGTWGVEATGAITKQPSTQRYHTDWAGQLISPIWRLITPVSTLSSSPRSGKPWLSQPFTRLSSSTHLPFHPHTVDHVRERGRSLQLNFVFFYCAMKLQQALDYSIYGTDTGIHILDVGCHRTNSFCPSPTCNRMCSAGAGAGTVSPLAFPCMITGLITHYSALRAYVAIRYW